MTDEPLVNVPQYRKLAQQLRQHIVTAALQPGDRLPSVTELQRSYGFNKYTIERAQRELSEEGLVVCRKGSGTYVATAKMAARTDILGLCGRGFSHPMSSSPYWSQVIHGIQTGARALMQHTLNLHHESTEGWNKTDGVLFTDESGKIIVNQIPWGQPCVSVLNDIDGYCSVFADDADGIRQSVEYLLALGHRNIAYIHSRACTTTARRIKAYRAAMNAAGIQVPVTWMRQIFGLQRYVWEFDYGARFVETGRENMETWLGDGWAHQNCTAILAHNDELAMGIIQALTAAGIRVPEDVSIIGFDGIEGGRHFSPSLTTVEVPLQQIGREAAGLLLEQITAVGPNDGKHMLPVKLQVRSSTAAPAASK